MNVFIARHLTAALYGDFSLALKFLLVVSNLVLLGTNLGAKRFLSELLSRRKFKDSQKYISWNLRFIRISFLILLIFALISLGVVLLLHYMGIHAIDEQHIVIFMLWIVPLSALCVLFCSYLIANNNVFIAIFLTEIARNSALLVFFILSIYFLDRAFTALHLTLVILAAYFVYFICMFCITRAQLPKIIKWSFEKLASTHTNWSTTSLKLLSNGILFNFLCISDLLIIELFSGNESEVGFYSVASIIASFIFLVTNAVYNIVVPKIGYLLKTDRNELQKLLNKMTILITVFLSIIVALLVAFIKKLLLHFGSSYLAAESSTIILVIATVLAAYSRSSVQLLVHSGDESFLLLTGIIELAVVVCVGIVATHFYGMIGMAITYAMSVTIKTVISIIRIKVKLKLRPILIL
jgi:O-antigen/teichoic acid export membrane protein